MNKSKETLNEPKENKIEKEYNKWKSRRWLITLWSMLMVTLIVILGTVFHTDSYSGLATSLVAVPIGFVSLETVNKWKRKEVEQCN